MIEVSGVLQTRREARAVTRGWGPIHWVIQPWHVCYFALLLYGLIVPSFVREYLPPYQHNRLLLGTWVFWLATWAVLMVAQLMVGRVVASVAKSSAAGRMADDWQIGRDGITLNNQLQTSRLDWRAIRAVREEKDRFLFLVLPNHNLILPKRGLREGQLIELQALIAEVTASGRLGRGVD